MDSRAAHSSSLKEKHLRSPETEFTSPLDATIQAGQNAPIGHRSEPSKHTSTANNTRNHKIENTDHAPAVHEAALKKARAEEAAEQITHRNQTKATVSTDDTAEDDIEETIVTPGARLAEELDLAKALKDAEDNMHQNWQEAAVTDEIEEDEAEEAIASAGIRPPSDIGEALRASASASAADLAGADGDGSSNSMPPRPEGFAMPDELPTWFPEHIKAIYTVDRQGGALSYKVCPLFAVNPC